MVGALVWARVRSSVAGPVVAAKRRQGKSMVEAPPKQFGFPVTWVASEQRLAKGLKQQLPKTWCDRTPFVING